MIFLELVGLFPFRLNWMKQKIWKILICLVIVIPRGLEWIEDLIDYV
jgi:hypothetical protein